LATTLAAGELEAAAAARREDLLMHHALGVLNKTASINRPSAGIVRDIRAHVGSQKELAVQAMDYLRELADETRVRVALQAAATDRIGIFDHRGRLFVDGDRAEEMPGLLRCYFGCATFLAGEPDTAFLLRIDPMRRQVVMWPLIDPEAPLPRSELSVRVDLRRQDVRVRPDARKLLRKGELQGASTRTKQRRLEAGYRATAGLGEDAVLERLDRDPMRAR
jgi:hypothetical protein